MKNFVIPMILGMMLTFGPASVVLSQMMIVNEHEDRVQITDVFGTCSGGTIDLSIVNEKNGLPADFSVRDYAAAGVMIGCHPSPTPSEMVIENEFGRMVQITDVFGNCSGGTIDLSIVNEKNGLPADFSVRDYAAAGVMIGC